MELTPWTVVLKPGWDCFFKKFDKQIQKQIMNKIDQMEQPLHSRGLHSLRFLVEEVGQCRIAFEIDEISRTKFIHFVGNHKQYEKWYKKF